MNRIIFFIVSLLALIFASTAGAQISVFAPPLEAGDDFVEAGGSSTFFDSLANDAVFGLGQLDPLSFELLEEPAHGQLDIWSVTYAGVELAYFRDFDAPWEADSARYRICTVNGECDEAVIWLLTGSIAPQVSTAADRSDAVDLAYAVLSGNVYIFLPDLFNPGTVTSVRFLVNGDPTNFDREPPYDMIGGTPTAAEPLNTTALKDGSLVVTTEIKFTEDAGGHVVRFDSRTAIANRPLLAFSYSPDRESGSSLEGGFFGGNVYVFVAIAHLNPGIGAVPLGGTEVRSVQFVLDGKKMRTENQTPYDLGGGSVVLSQPFDMSSLAEGPHKLVAVIRYLDGRVEQISARFDAI